MNDKFYPAIDQNGEESSVRGHSLKRHLQEKSDEDLWMEVARQSLHDQHVSEYEIASLAKMELERRAFEETKSLARRTTLYSGFMGILGSVIGVALGYYLGTL